MTSRVGDGTKQDYIAALLYALCTPSQSQLLIPYYSLNIPANNCVILQRGDDLELVGAGQHCITNPNVTMRGIFTMGECQTEMPTKDIFTRDQVPVSLTIYLKW